MSAVYLWILCVCTLLPWASTRAPRRLRIGLTITCNNVVGCSIPCDTLHAGQA